MNRLLKSLIPLLCAILLLASCSKIGTETSGIADAVAETLDNSTENDDIADVFNLETDNDGLVDDLFSLYYDDTDSLNPYATSNEYNLAVTQLIYEGLYELQSDFTAEPVIAYNCVSSDNRSFVISLHSGKKFSDGREVTSADVIYSIETAVASARYCSRLADIESYEALGAYGLKITLSEPNCRFTALLDFPIIPNGEAESEHPVGTGAYEYAESAEYAYLRPRSGGLRQIYLYSSEEEPRNTYFESGAVDLVLVRPLKEGELSYGGHNDITRYDTTVMHYLGFNLINVTRSEIRRIISNAIDRDELVLSALESAAHSASLPVSPSAAYYDTELSREFGCSSVLAAERMCSFTVSDVDEDGVIELSDENGVYVLSYKLIVNAENKWHCAAARLISEQLSAFGFLIDVEELYWEDYIDALKKGEYDIYYGAVNMTADFDLDPLLSRDGELNYSFGFDPDYAELNETYQSGGAEKAMLALYEEVGSYAQIIPLAFERAEIVTHRYAVDGISPTPHNLFHGIENWSF